jgi:integrase
MQGIERRHATNPNQVAPLLLDDLTRIVPLMGRSLPDVRDRALLLVGFFGALRRSEIVALNFDDVRFRENGLDLVIRKSKTDQLQAGRIIHLRRATTALDPAKALQVWLVQGKIAEGPIYRCMGVPSRLSDHAVARIVKKWASRIGHAAEHFSGHSLRAGFATSAALAGLDPTLIARQTGHKSSKLWRLMLGIAKVLASIAENASTSFQV